MTSSSPVRVSNRKRTLPAILRRYGEDGNTNKSKKPAVSLLKNNSTPKEFVVIRRPGSEDSTINFLSEPNLSLRGFPKGEDPMAQGNDHMMKEKVRRERIKESCDKLRFLLPYIPGRKMDMASILELCVDYLDIVVKALPIDFNKQVEGILRNGAQEANGGRGPRGQGPKTVAQLQREKRELEKAKRTTSLPPLSIMGQPSLLTMTTSANTDVAKVPISDYALGERAKKNIASKVLPVNSECQDGKKKKSTEVVTATEVFSPPNSPPCDSDSDSDSMPSSVTSDTDQLFIKTERTSHEHSPRDDVEFMMIPPSEIKSECISPVPFPVQITPIPSMARSEATVTSVSGSSIANPEMSAILIKSTEEISSTLPVYKGEPNANIPGSFMSLSDVKAMTEQLRFLQERVTKLEAAPQPTSIDNVTDASASQTDNVTVASASRTDNVTVASASLTDNVTVASATLTNKVKVAKLTGFVVSNDPFKKIKNK